MRRVLNSTKPFVFVLFLVGVTVRSAESLSSAIPQGSTKRANSKRANHGRWRTRSLPSVSGFPTRWRCVRGWLMRLLLGVWAWFRSDLAFPLWKDWHPLPPPVLVSLQAEDRRLTLSGRSEGDSKSLSAGYIPTDLLLLTQRTSRPFPRWFRWSVPRGAQYLIRCFVCK